MAELIKVKGKRSFQELACSLFAEVIPTMAFYSQAVTHVVDFYLDDERQAAREDLIRLTGIHSADAEEQIMAYVREALST
jgi:linoleate 10R-lipoxygenase